MLEEEQDLGPVEDQIRNILTDIEVGKTIPTQLKTDYGVLKMEFPLGGLPVIPTRCPFHSKKQSVLNNFLLKRSGGLSLIYLSELGLLQLR